MSDRVWSLTFHKRSLTDFLKNKPAGGAPGHRVRRGAARAAEFLKRATRVATAVPWDSKSRLLCHVRRYESSDPISLDYNSKSSPHWFSPNGFYFNSNRVCCFSASPSLEYLLGSRTVSDNPPRHSGVRFRRDF